MPIRPLGKAVHQVSVRERNEVRNSLNKGENLAQRANRLIEECNYPLALNMVAQALIRNPKDAELLELRAKIYTLAVMPGLTKLNLPELINKNSLTDSTISDLSHLAKLVKLGVQDLRNSSRNAEESETIIHLNSFMNFVSDSILTRVSEDQIRAQVLQIAGAGNKAELAETAKKIFDNSLKAIGLATEPTTIMHNLVGTYGLAFARAKENLSAIEKKRILNLGLKHTEIAERKFMDNSDPYFDITSGYYSKDQINNLTAELLSLRAENSFKEREALKLSKAGNFDKAVNLARECSQFDYERYEGFNLLSNIILSELGSRYKANTLQSLPESSIDLTKEGFNAVQKALRLFPPRDTENIYSEKDISEIGSHLILMQDNFLFLKRYLRIE